MYVDALTLFSEDQALTATAVSTNVVDLGPLTNNTTRKIGLGEPLAVILAITVAADFTTGNETYQVDIQTDDNDSFSSATVVQSEVITAARMTVGAVITIALSSADFERYVRLNYTLGGTTPTVTLTAWLAPLSFAQNTTFYADNVTVS